MPYGNVSSYCNYSERGPRQVGATTKLKQSLPAINREAFTFQPELRSGYYTPMRERPFVEQSQGTLRPLAFEIKFSSRKWGELRITFVFLQWRA